MNIIVTGGSGFLGSCLCTKLSDTNNQVFIPRSKEFNLIDKNNVEKLILYAGVPDAVVHLAAKCGGIGANKTHPGSYFYENMIMGVNLIEACRKFKVPKVVLIGTVCSYPKHCEVPFKESDMWSGFPEETNAPYGIAKKSLHVMLDAYRKQYGLNSTILVSSNLYGPNDNFKEESSHVIPALIKKIYLAKINKLTEVEVWGDGTASREFLYVQDAAEAIYKSIFVKTDTTPINLGTGREITIKNLALQIKLLLGYKGSLKFNSTLPNGQPRRCLDTVLAKSILNFQAKTPLRIGLENTIDWFLNNLKQCI